MTARSADTATDTARDAGWLVPVLTVAAFVTMLHAMVLGPLLPDMASDLGTSVSLLGQIPAATMLLAALIGFVAGPLADRFGHHRALLASLVVLVVSSVGMALAPGYLLLFVATLIGSVGRAVVQPVAIVIAGERFSGDRQRRAVSWVMAGMSGAVIAGVPVLTAIAGFFGWRAAIGSLAVLIALSIPAVRRGLGAAPQRAVTRMSVAGVLNGYGPLIHHRPTLGLVIASLIGNAGVWIMATYLGAFYDERYGYTTQQIGWVYFVPGVALFVGSLATGGRIGALPLRPLVIATRLATGIAIAGLFIFHIPALAGLGLLGIQGVATAASMVAVVLLLMRESPASRATTLTLNTVALSLGIALGSMLGGVLLAVSDYHLLGFASLLLSGGSAFLVWSSRGEPVSETTVPATRQSL